MWRRDPSPRRGERGSALVLAILILFAMLALGLLAMRTATQNIAGAGNVRLQKQARYVAESGLYAALGYFDNQSAGSRELISAWHAATAEEGLPPVIVLDDRGGARVVRVGADGQPAGAPVYEAPAPVALSRFISSGPDPLGRYGETSGLVTSYEVRVEGLQVWDGRTGGDVDRADSCLIHATSRGYIADTPVGGDGFDDARDDIRFTEHALRAGMVITVEPPNNICQNLGASLGGAP